MTYTISKEFPFSAAHYLVGLPDDHPCSRLHGHNYTATLTFAGDLDARGFVIDYGDLKPFKNYLDQRLDHRLLNDALDFNPTAELLAKHLYWTADDLFDIPPLEVTVQETPKTTATYRP